MLKALALDRSVRPVQMPARARFVRVPPENQSDTLTPESIAVQVMEEHPNLMKRYAGGDLEALTILQQEASKLAAGRVDEKTLSSTIMRKLGASI